MIKVDGKEGAFYSYIWPGLRTQNGRRLVGYFSAGYDKRLIFLIFCNVLIAIGGLLFNFFHRVSEQQLERFNSYSFVLITYLIGRAMVAPVRSIEIEGPIKVLPAPLAVWTEFLTHMGTILTLLVIGIANLPSLRVPFYIMVAIWGALASAPIVCALRAKTASLTTH
jgi:hypothetical protein